MSNNTFSHINFLEQTEHVKTPFELTYAWIIGLMVCLSCAGALFTGIQQHRIKIATQRVSILTEEFTIVKKQESAITGDGKDSGSINSALGNPVYWSPLLKKITHKTPLGIRLAQVATSIQENRGITLRGYAPDIREIDKLRNGLATIQQCSQASLAGVELQENSNGNHQLVFQIDCGVK